MEQGDDACGRARRAVAKVIAVMVEPVCGLASAATYEHRARRESIRFSETARVVAAPCHHTRPDVLRRSGGQHGCLPRAVLVLVPVRRCRGVGIDTLVQTIEQLSREPLGVDREADHLADRRVEGIDRRVGTGRERDLVSGGEGSIERGSESAAAGCSDAEAICRLAIRTLPRAVLLLVPIRRLLIEKSGCGVAVRLGLCAGLPRLLNFGRDCAELRGVRGTIDHT
mmetsp:Transcript_22181/g.56657  ORF Transcript_22181/g.56657 Transcript_22181/m.56657 type:complete len:226 (-) Transcript_22181:30-707(-)